MLLNQKTQCDQHVSSTKSEMQIQCNHNQNPGKVFGRNLQAYLTLYMEIQGPRAARIILKRQQMTTWFEDFLYCYNHLGTVELAKSCM